MLFIDRNSGGRTFRDLLTAQGIKVILHDDHFPRTAADEDWVLSVGEKGWIVITGDDATTRTPLFLQRLATSKTFVFVLHGLNGSSREGKAACILAAYQSISNLVAQHRPPGVWRIGKDGTVRLFDFRRVLEKMHRSGKV